jgi:Rrf2 family protein
MLAIHRLRRGESPATAERIAQECGKPRRYLEQIIHMLKRAGLLFSTSGRLGGYRLARPADQIRLREITDATIGPVGLVECVLHPNECTKADCCELRLIYLMMSTCINQALESCTLADLDDPAALTAIAGDLQKQLAANAGNDTGSLMNADLVPSRFLEDQDQKL